jgi:divalent metal cation (Fe/Co/Zn/Cd) transporter
VAAIWIGSAVMMSGAIHSLVDTANELLFLYGIRHSKRKPDVDHPFGYGRKVYFWSFVVSLLILALGAGQAFPAEVIDHRQHPELAARSQGVGDESSDQRWLRP